MTQGTPRRTTAPAHTKPHHSRTLWTWHLSLHFHLPPYCYPYTDPAWKERARVESDQRPATDNHCPESEARRPGAPARTRNTLPSPLAPT
eukprot:10383076-Alexandrium_andersonii.AAC.1